ncbi:ribbon-helix-helix protein, CopG family [bacterium]|nr:ribbon-helix-helix protein, CopG family [bacterium]
MTAAKIAISIDPSLLDRIDSLVRERYFRSRSEMFQMAISEQIARFDEDRLGAECAKLDPTEEQAFADMGLLSDLSEWPAY